MRAPEQPSGWPEGDGAAVQVGLLFHLVHQLQIPDDRQALRGQGSWSPTAYPFAGIHECATR